MEILVAAATGRLGVPLTRHLLAREHVVRALTRFPGSERAVRLENQGARVFQGDFDDPAALRQAAEGVDAVLVSSTPHHGIGPDAEVRHAIASIEAAISAAAFVVYVSAAGADRAHGVPMLASKWTVEEHLRAANIRHAIIAPVFFMENLAYPWNAALLRRGVWPVPLPPDQTVQLVAIDDVAAVAAEVIERGEEFAGRRVEVAADELTGPQAALVLTRVLARSVHHTATIPDELAAMSPFFGWLAKDGFHVPLRALRREFPAVNWQTFAYWAANQEWD